MRAGRSTRSDGQDELQDVLQGHIRWPGGLGYEAAEGIGAGEQPPQTDVHRCVFRERRAEGCHRKKDLGIDERSEIIQHLVAAHDLPIQRACRAVNLDRATAPHGLAENARVPK